MGRRVLTSDEGFNRFWAAYPKRVARLDALKAWTQLAPVPDMVEEILAAIEWQRRQPSWTKDDGQYVPYAGSWLRAERWTDEPPPSLVKPARRYWADECAELHGGTCEKRWDHEMRKRDVAV